ncbi:iron-sulfur cluster assembly protein, partial [Phycicoccus avicenniae]|uniref:iron-sulfur cluster assembly protein n=1 Tax=Phycicoccus avicenniae TaxID=2828860 RepID=UPI003D2B6856
MTALATRAPTDADVRAALGTVLDPELDEPITDLGFVRSLALDGPDVRIHLRLPTSFCSPNFAYLMASDAKDAVGALEGVGVVGGGGGGPPPAPPPPPDPGARERSRVP